LIEPANNIPANPMQTPNHIVPEWYFLPFYAILRSVPNMVGGVVAMGLSVMLFAFMPFLDRSRIPGGGRYRPIYRVQFYLFLLVMLVLGWVGYVPPTDRTILIGQVATLLYFSSFFFVPFISKAEERWLMKRGLPVEVTALMESETLEIAKRKLHPRRRKGEAA
jgi:ubiquinol-cytochrome c reductase cytochrome b subunit